GVVAQPVEGAALATNAAYARLFTQLALGSLAPGALGWAARPWLRQLIDGTPARCTRRAARPAPRSHDPRSTVAVAAAGHQRCIASSTRSSP
ncbi:hypothetical protein ABTL20_20740, partial [Acinetobacter baumannii]